MSGAFTRVGKQILAHGFHYADAADERAAIHILDCLNATPAEPYRGWDEPDHDGTPPAPVTV